MSRKANTIKRCAKMLEMQQKLSKPRTYNDHPPAKSVYDNVVRATSKLSRGSQIPRGVLCTYTT